MRNVSDSSIEFYRPAAENGSSSRASVVVTNAIVGAFADRTFHTRSVEQNTADGSNSEPYSFIHFSCIKSYCFEREQ